MKKFIFSFVLCLLLPLSIVADDSKRDAALKTGDVFVPREFRQRNQNGNCVWCAAETMCLNAGLESFRGIKERAVRKGWHGSGMQRVLEAMRDAEIPYAYQFHNASTKILEDAVKQGHAAYIEIPGHALLLVGIDEHSVRLLDNNGSLEVKEWSRQKFGQLWEGTACFPRIFRRRVTPFVNVQPNERHPGLNPNHPKEPLVIVEPKPDEMKPETPKPVEVKPDPVHAKLDAIIQQFGAYQSQISNLEKQIADLKMKPGMPGPKGDPGLPGRNGADGKDADTKTIGDLTSRLATLEESFRQLQLRIESYETTPQKGVIRVNVLPKNQ